MNSIYTIPLTDVFETIGGCPFCRLKKMLDDRAVAYISGAAMMEPEIRIETNKKGFCPDHFAKLYKNPNRLSLALILETHLDEIENKVFKGDIAKNAAAAAKSCYICEKVDGAFEKMAVNTVIEYEKNPAFKEMFLKQAFFCLEHLALLLALSQSKHRRPTARDFSERILKIEKAHLARLKETVNAFTRLFDYNADKRNAQNPEIKEAVANAISFVSRGLDF